MNTKASVLITAAICTACGGSGGTAVNSPATVQQQPPPTPSPAPTPAPPPPAPAPTPPPAAAPPPIAFSYLDLGPETYGIEATVLNVALDNTTGVTVYRSFQGMEVGQKGGDAFANGVDLGPGVAFDYNPNTNTAVGGSADGQPAIWRGGVMGLLSSANGGSAMSINDSGEIVGTENDQYLGDPALVMWDAAGNSVDFGTHSIQFTMPYGINCDGSILTEGYPVTGDPTIKHIYLLTRTDIKRSCP